MLRGGGLSQTDSDAPTSTSCRWFTDGGQVWNDCDASTLTQPLSWQIQNGVCTAYDNSACDNSANTDAYDSAQGCHNYNSDLDEAQTWVALRCGALETNVNGPLIQAGGHVGPLRYNTITTTARYGNHSNTTHTVTKAYDPAMVTTLATLTTKGV